MESIEAKIKAFLSGEVKDDPEKEFLNVDYSLDQQNYELSARGVEPKSPAEFKPKIGTTITYVVAAVIFNEKSEILMIQEAKRSCAGEWYLPAGRVEPNESIEDAVKREVVQETGFEFEPTTLLKVESSHGTWFRFVYTGNVVGGQLKTVAKADQESLQASYIADITKLTLRSQDCLKLIELGREYLKHRTEWHSEQLVISRLVPNIFLRLLIAIRSRQSNAYSVLISDSLVQHIPMTEINPARSVHATLKRFMQHIFGAEHLPQHKPVGILTVEHSFASEPDQYDGLCLTLLVVCKDPLEGVRTKTGFSWRQLDASLEATLVSKLSKYKTISLNVL